MKKAILTVCILAGLAAVSFFIPKETEDPGPMPNAQSEAVKQIGFYHYYSGTLSGGISEMIDQVNQSQDRFVVSARALDHEAFKSMIHTTLNKGNPPELFAYWAGARVQHLVDRGKLAPIDDFWERENLDQRFQPFIIDAACTYNGHKYLLPIDQHLVLFFYNTRLFREHDLTPPVDWKAFLAVCKALKAKGATPLALGARERWPAQFWLDYLLLRTRPVSFRKDLMTGRVPYTHPDVRNAYRLWAGLIEKGYFNPDANGLDWAEASRLVCRGEAAMTLMGTWAIPFLEGCGDWTGTTPHFDMFPFPQKDPGIPKAALGPIDGIVLSKTSANHEYAKTTLAYFAGRKPQEMLSKGSGALAPSLEVPLSFYSPFKKRIIEEIQSATHWAFNYDLATPPEIAEIGMNSFQELLEFPDQYEKILENLETEARQLFARMDQ